MAHPVDKYVGRRLRARRAILGFSQEEIGNRTGITFQQIQKYEKGFNRIAISRLYEFSRILQVPIEWFVEGFEEQKEVGNDLHITEFDNRETIIFIKVYSALPPIIRKRALQLFRAVVAGYDPDNQMAEDE